MSRGSSNASRAFSNVCSSDRTERKEVTVTRPFSIRLTHAERERLDNLAGHQPLGTYIRSVLLGDHVKKRRILRRPAANDQHVASALSVLGQSRQDLIVIAQHPTRLLLEHPAKTLRRPGL